MLSVTRDDMKTFRQYRVDSGAKDLHQIHVISMAINMIEIKGP
jgi:hypothetical protein